MKMYYGNTQIKSMKVGTDTDDATLVASDLQSGVTAYARGRKVVGTGKCFSFAMYGGMSTNMPWPIPDTINVIEIASAQYPVQLSIVLNDMSSIDFSTVQTIGNIVIDGVAYPVTVDVANNLLTIMCDKTVTLQVFFGKDEYR